MRGLKGLGPLVAIGIAGLIWLLFASEPGSHWLTSFIAPDSPPGPVVGRLLRVEGSAKRIHSGDVQEIKGPLATPLEIGDGDRIETSEGATALLVLNSQDELELASLSAVTVQLWNPKDPNSALYLNILTGDLELKKAGVRGRAYLVRDGRLYLPGQKPSQKPMALTVLRSAPLDMQLAENQAGSVAEFESDEKPVDDKLESGIEPETLANEYIDELISSRQSQLQKCWLSRLKEKPDLKGQILVQFEITRRGKVRELKIADTTINDEQLQKCVMTVIERITFRSYTGSEISLSYPIKFE